MQNPVCLRDKYYAFLTNIYIHFQLCEYQSIISSICFQEVARESDAFLFSARIGKQKRDTEVSLFRRYLL